jgi:hypothetical protein
MTKIRQSTKNDKPLKYMTISKRLKLSALFRKEGGGLDAMGIRRRFEEEGQTEPVSPVQRLE